MLSKTSFIYRTNHVHDESEKIKSVESGSKIVRNLEKKWFVLKAVN